MSEYVVFDLSGDENVGVGRKINILVLIFPYILIYGIFTNFCHFWPILVHWDSILGYLITLDVSKCFIRAQPGWKWGNRNKNEHASPDISVYTDVWHFYQFWPFLTNFRALGLNFGIPNHFRCLNVLYSSSAGLKMWEYHQKLASYSWYFYIYWCMAF